MCVGLARAYSYTLTKRDIVTNKYGRIRIVIILKLILESRGEVLQKHFIIIS
jgi:hypothetical protein